jgi:heme iron utilization protein
MAQLKTIRGKDLMDKDQSKIKRELRKLLRSQSLAVLATQNQGQPYASLVAFVSSDDLKSLYFATIRSTRKYANLSGDSRVAMLFDNRSNKSSDFRLAMAATATGTAAEVPPRERERALGRYLAKYPHLNDFVHSPTCALCKIRVRTFFVVTRFQSVVEVRVRP